MANINNPAGRLYLILAEGRKKGKNTTTHDVWPYLLNVSKEDTATLFRKLGQVMALPAVIRDEVYKLENVDHSLLLQWLPKVNQAFHNLNFQSKWHEFIGYIDEAVLYGLQICDDMLARTQRDVQVNEDELTNIHAEALELFKEILHSEIDHELKKYLLEQLRLIDNAIQDYRIGGIKPIEAALDATIGKIVRDPKVLSKSKQPQTVERFWKFVHRVFLVVGITAGSLQIGKNAISLQPEDAGRQTVVVVNENATPDSTTTEIVENDAFNSEESENSSEPNNDNNP